MRFLLLDLAHARRLLVGNKRFVTFAVAMLAVGIGASTLVFSLVNAALLRALPFEDPGSLVWMYNARIERDRAPFSIADIEDYRRDNRTLAGLAVFTNWSANLTGSGPAERLEGTRVSGNFFRLLGARPLIGRTLEPADETGQPRAAVMTYGLWKRRFGGETGIVGRDVILNGSGYTVVGVLPPGFVFPFREAELAVPATPGADPRRTDRGANFLRAVARLAPGTSLEAAKADLDAIARRLQRDYPNDDSRKTGVNLYPLHEEIVRDYRQILWTLLAAVGLFLLIGTGNLANLMFVRSIGRENEFSLRAALGASRARIVRQLALEAMIIAALGGVFGTALAKLGLVLWARIGPANFPRRDEITLDPMVLSFAIGVVVVAALVCTIVPARVGIRPATIASGTRTAGASRRDRFLRRAFVTIQAAGAVLLVIGMGLVARGFAGLERVDVGFTPAKALSMQLSLPPQTYDTPASIDRLYQALRVRFESIGGVRAAGAVSLRPLTGLLSTMDVAFPGRPAPPPDEVPQAHFRIASAGYFAAAGIAVIAGRAFTEQDRSGSQPVAIVSRTFAERHWAGESAIGKAVQLVQGAPSESIEVVGVVSDVKQFGMDGTPTADLYLPLPQMPASQASLMAARMFWVLRSESDAVTLVNRVRGVVASIDPDVAASSVQTMDEIVSASLAGWRLNVRLLEAFAQLAVLLCAVGVYAVASFAAGTRRRELAVRAALGATRRELTTLVMREELRPVAIGLAVGVTFAFVAAPRLGALLFDTSPFDLRTYAAACVGVVLVGALASYAPARHAGRVDPAQLLHS